MSRRDLWVRLSGAVPSRHRTALHDAGRGCAAVDIVIGCRGAGAVGAAPGNKRCNRHVTAFGETLIIPDWAARTGLSPETIRSRILRGEPHEQAVSRRPDRSYRRPAA